MIVIDGVDTTVLDLTFTIGKITSGYIPVPSVLSLFGMQLSL